MGSVVFLNWMQLINTESVINLINFNGKSLIAF